MNINSHPWFDPEALVGTTIDGYQLNSLAGSGGFGAVYATESQDSVPLALKLMYPPFSNAPEDMESWAFRANLFLREALTAASFRQPNIIRVYGAGQFLWHHDDTRGGTSGSDYTGDYLLPYYVADYLPDGLERRGGGSFKPNEAVRIAEGICDGLMVLHSAEPKVLHLDLNPGNIRLANDDRPVIADFGVARTGPILPEVTVAPAVYPGVVAPEQLRGEKPDERTDIYQLGSLLCWMLIGHYPNMGAIPGLIARPDIPEHLKRTILKCVDENRDRRFQDVASLNAALAVKTSLIEQVKQFFANLIPSWWRRSVVAAVALLMILVTAWAIGLFPPYGSVEITIASSSAKREWINESVKLFNEQSKRDRSLQWRRNSLQLFGRPINVTVVLEEIEPGDWDHYRSGTMVRDLLDGKIQPTIVSPADTVWIEKIIRDWLDSDSRRNSNGGALVMTADAEDLMNVPFVIAMWESRARVLDCWPEAGPGCTWKSIVELASNPEGWGSLGRPEWGNLKFGYAIPGKSNSATFTAMFICLSGLDFPDTVTPDDIGVSNPCGQEISDLEKGDIIPATSSSQIMSVMRRGGPGCLDAVPTYEAEVVEINVVYKGVLPELLVSAYPQDGTTATTHPFAVLDAASWVSEREADAARIFQQFLLEPEQQKLLVRHGLRPINRNVQVGSPIDTNHGANPSADLLYPNITLNATDRLVEVWDEVISTSRDVDAFPLSHCRLN